MKKYKTIKEEKAYLEGYDDGSREQAHVFEDMLESAEEIKKSMKYGTGLSTTDLVTKVLVSAVVSIFVIWLLSVFINPVPTFN